MIHERLRSKRRVAAIILFTALVLALGAVTLASAVITQKGNIRLVATADMRPARLSRSGTTPISVSLGGEISTTDESPPPALKSISIQINRHGHLDYQGLPTCSVDRIQPASSSAALAACRPALIGRGKFSGAIILPGQLPYPIRGLLLVFNGRQHGHEVLFGHVYSGKPFPTSFVMTFRISSIVHGTYGTTLTADLTKTLGKKRSLSSIEMTLSRRYSAGGKRHSFLSAGCPAPRGFSKAVFPLVRTSFAFAGGQTLSSTLTRSCRAKG